MNVFSFHMHSVEMDLVEQWKKPLCKKNKKKIIVSCMFLITALGYYFL